MKKVILFLGAAAIIGVGSAFTSQMMDPPTSGSYVVVGDTYVPESLVSGDCILNEATCSWSKTGSEPGPMNDEFKNPANFAPLDPGTFIED